MSGYAYKYKLYDNEKYCGTFSAGEISEMTGISSKLISEYASDEMVYKKRCKFEFTLNGRIGWKEEWNKARKRVLDAMKRGSVG